MQVVVLAGGKGTRLAPLTDTMPKVLVPVAGKPFAEHQIDLLRQGGATSLIYAIGHMGNQICAHLGDGSRFGIPIAYVDDGVTPRGTAGCFRQAADDGVLDDRFLLIYGDSYLPVDLRPIWDDFTAATQPALMTIFHNDGRWDRSNVAMAADGKTIALYDKQNRYPDITLDHIDYGISGLTRDIIVRHIPPAPAAMDLADLMHELSVNNQLAAHATGTRFWEIGSHEGLAELHDALITGTLPQISGRQIGDPR
ncbi:MAG: sugar phosphate nucleotidyltransferase [Pseudomonadota bacterium]